MSPLLQAFERFGHLKWFFVRPGGNWGDALIYEGAFVLARRMQIDFEDVVAADFDFSGVDRRSAIYLQGGGGFNPWGSGTPFTSLSRAIDSQATVVVQGPQTIAAEAPWTVKLLAKSLARSTPERILFCAREETSFRFLQEHFADMMEVAQAEDTALALEREDLLRLAELDFVPSGRYRFTVARRDDEMPRQETPTDTVCLDPAYFARSLRHWVRLHAFATDISSNRLHSAIAGTILGKRVTLGPGSYHKNRSIWEYSLRRRGVEWCDDATSFLGSTRGERVSGWLTKHSRRSWKLHRIMLRYRGVPMS